VGAVHGITSGSHSVSSEAANFDVVTRGKPLGISARVSNSDRCLDFPADAFIFLCSDGLLDVRGHVGLVYEMDGLSASLADRSPKPGADNLSGLPAKFQVRTTLSLHDDLIPL